MEICTIGFSKKTAQQFFETLRREQIQRLIDVRIHNSSQLAGFTKKDNLAYFLRELCSADYVAQPILAPTAELLASYRTKQMSWLEYEQRFLDLMRLRKIQDCLNPELFERRSVLLCSESTPDKCHRRIVLEYLQRFWPSITIKHL
jgi:uncharacterized protein (DUF488 family)